MVQKYDRFAIQEPETETNLAVSVAAGIGSGLIKIPLGLVYTIIPVSGILVIFYKISNIEF